MPDGGKRMPLWLLLWLLCRRLLERVSKLDRRASNTGARRLIRLGGWRLPRVVRAVTPRFD